MTDRQELINAIEKECHLANPSLLKLEFGQKVKLEQNSNDGMIMGSAYGKWLYYNYDAQNCFIRDFSKDEILGKEPQLNHILKLLQSKIFIDSYGNIYMDIGMTGEHGRSVEATWNLDVGLFSQETPTLQFIYSLLGNSILD